MNAVKSAACGGLGGALKEADDLHLGGAVRGGTWARTKISKFAFFSRMGRENGGLLEGRKKDCRWPHDCPLIGDPVGGKENKSKRVEARPGSR